MEIKDLTKEQRDAILSAYLVPGRGVKAVVKRLKATGLPLKVCTAWLMLYGYIGYNDKLRLDGAE